MIINKSGRFIWVDENEYCAFVGRGDGKPLRVRVNYYKVGGEVLIVCD